MLRTKVLAFRQRNRAGNQARGPIEILARPNRSWTRNSKISRNQQARVSASGSSHQTARDRWSSLLVNHQVAPRQLATVVAAGLAAGVAVKRLPLSVGQSGGARPIDDQLVNVVDVNPLPRVQCHCQRSRVVHRLLDTNPLSRGPNDVIVFGILGAFPGPAGALWKFATPLAVVSVLNVCPP
jgi:hypothetical protein